MDCAAFTDLLAERGFMWGKGEMITIQDLSNAVYFLRQVVARGDNEQLLLNLVGKMEHEIADRKQKQHDRQR